MTALTPQELAKMKRLANSLWWDSSQYRFLVNRYERNLATYMRQSAERARIQRGLAGNVIAANSAFSLQLQAERQADYDADRADALALLGCV
jgi:hypothetical protein